MEDIEFVGKDIQAKTEKPKLSTAQQALRNKDISNSSQNFFGQKSKDNDFAFKDYNVNIDQAYQKLNSGTYVRKFDSFIPGTNNEERLAKNQTSGEKWANGLSKLAGKTGTAVLGGTIGVVDGIVQGISEGSMEAVYNSDFNEWLDDLNTKMDYKLPNYYTEQEKDMGFFQSMGTANFWANDVTSGLSFTLGTIVSEGIWAYATGGTSLIAKGALGATTRWGSKALSTRKSLDALNKYKEVTKTLLRKEGKEAVEELGKSAVKGLKLSRLANNARFIATSAGYEAGVEARHYMKSTEENWMNTFQELNGRRPTAEEISSFKSELNDTANGVFGSNLALVGASNLAMFGKILKGTPVNQTIKNTAFKNKVLGVGYEVAEDGSKVALKASKAQRVARGVYTFGKYGALEGIVEEGGQGVITATGENFMLDTFKNENIDTSIGLMDSVIKGFEESYGTKEGQKGIGIGFIIGLFGGAASTRGRFNELSSEQKEISAQVDYSNAVTHELVLNRVKELSRQQNAAQKTENAQRKGDLVGEEMGRREGFYARAIRDIRLGGLESGFDDMQTALDKTDNNEIREILGKNATDEDIKSYKQDIFDQYKKVAQKTERNLTYAESILGDSQIAGLDNTNTKEIAEAIGYTLTMGEVSDEITDGIAERMKEIATESFGAEASNTITVENALKKVSDNKLKDIKNATRRKQDKIKKIETLTTSLVDAQNIENREDNTKRDKRVASLTQQLTKATNELVVLEQQQQTAYRASNIENISNGQVTIDMLENQAENVKLLSSSMESLSPQDKEVMGKLIRNYEKGVATTKEFNRTIRTLSNPKSRVNLLNGWVSNLVNKNKKLPEGLASMFNENLETYMNSQARVKSEVEQANQPQEQPTQKNSVQAPVETQQEKVEPKNYVENIETRINNTLNDKGYLKEYVGDNPTENNILDKKKVDRFKELLEKIKIDPNTVVNQPFNQDSGLTEEETTEFNQLNQDLNDWKLIDGSGIGDLLKLLKIAKKDVERQNTAIKTDTKKIVIATEAERNEGSENASGNVNTVIAPAEKVAKFNKKTGNYEISHTDIDSLLEIIPGSDITLNGKPLASLTSKQKKTPGAKFKLTLGEKSTQITINDNKRLVVDKTDFDVLTENGPVKIVDLSISNFMPLYDMQGNPLKGDFQIEPIDGETIVYNEDVTNAIKKGDTLTAEIYVNDTYNKVLMEQYNKGQITKEELANQFVIYLKHPDYPNTVVGMMRGLSQSNEPSPSVFALKQIRDTAIEKVLEGNLSKIDLGLNIPVERVLLGNPNVKVTEQDGNLVTETIPFNEDSIKNIRATGYALDGKITLNKNIEFNQGIAKRVSNLSENKGKKVPVVVFEYMGKNIAFPVDLVETEAGLLDRTNEILDTNLDSIKKAEMFTEFLQQNGIDIKGYNLDIQEGWENSPEIESILDEVESKKNVADLNSWIDKNYNPIDLIEQAQIAVDITDRPILSSKVIIKLEDAITGIENPVAQAQQRRPKEEVELERIELVEQISEEARQVEILFRDSSDLSNSDVDSDFLAAMYDRDIEKTKGTYIQEQKNVSILTEMFSHKIPKKVKEKMGAQRYDYINTLLQRLEAVKEEEKTAVYSDTFEDMDYVSVDQNLNIESPQDNRRTAMELLGGIKDREEFERVLFDSDMEYLKNLYNRTKGGEDDIFIKYSQYDKVKQATVENGQIENKENSAEEYLMEVLTIPSDELLGSQLDFILDLNPITVELNQEAVDNLLEDILDNTVDIGLDLETLKGKSLTELKPLLETISDYLSIQDGTSFDNLVTEYNRAMGMEGQAEQLVKIDSLEIKPEFTLYIETDKSEYQMYKDHNLLKIGENLYAEMEDQDLNIMYNNVLEQDNIFATLSELQEYVQYNSRVIETGAVEVEPEILEKIVLSKLNFGIEQQILPNLNMEKEAVFYNEPISNAEYLQTSYIADLNKQIIREKRRNSDIYLDTLSNLKIDGNGIQLINNDPQSIASMMTNMDSNLENYLKLTGQIPTDSLEDVFTRSIKRSIVLDNPKSIPIFTKEYQKINDQTIMSKEKTDFIRTQDNLVYENTGEFGDYSFYSQLDINPSEIKQFIANSTAPELNINFEDYKFLQQPDYQMKVTNKYTATELEDIDDNLECK